MEEERPKAGPNGSFGDSDQPTAVEPLIFLSYGSNNKKEARELRTILKESGYRVWMAPDDIRGTRPWAEQILDAIADAAMMVVLVSSDSNRSDHVGREVSLAFEQGKPVLPVRVEDVAMSGILRYHLSIVQNFDAFPPPLKAHKANLVKEVASRLGDTPDWPDDSNEDLRWMPPTKVMLLVGGFAGLLTVVAIVFAFGRQGVPPETTISDTTTTVQEITTTTGGEGTSTTTRQPSTTVAESFRRFSDDTGELVVDAPPDWVAQGTAAELNDSEIGPALTVASDIDTYQAGFEAPGVFIFASRIMFEQYETPEAYLNSLSKYQPCDEPVRRPYQDGKYMGIADYYTNCGTTGVKAFKLVAVPIEEPDYLIAVLYKGQSGDDSALTEKILETFNYEGAFEWTPPS